MPITFRFLSTMSHLGCDIATSSFYTVFQPCSHNTPHVFQAYIPHPSISFNSFAPISHFHSFAACYFSLIPWHIVLCFASLSHLAVGSLHAASHLHTDYQQRQGTNVVGHDPQHLDWDAHFWITHPNPNWDEMHLSHNFGRWLTNQVFAKSPPKVGSICVRFVNSNTPLVTETLLGHPGGVWFSGDFPKNSLSKTTWMFWERILEGLWGSVFLSGFFAFFLSLFPI